MGTSDPEAGITTIYHDLIKPEFLIRDVNNEKIVWTAKKYQPNGFIVNSYVDEDKIEKLASIMVFGGFHPNVDHITMMYCMPDWMNEKPMNSNLIHDIRVSLRCWNLLSCFYVPKNSDYKSEKI